MRYIIDSTHIEAKVDLFWLKKKEKEDDDDDYVDRSSPDKDARLGRKTPPCPALGRLRLVCFISMGKWY